MQLAAKVYLAYQRYMVDEKGWSYETRRARNQAIEAFAVFTATSGESVLTADKKMILGFIGRTKQPRTRNNYLCSLRAFYVFAVRDSYRRDDPCAGIERVREPRSLPRPLSRQEADAMLTHAAEVSPRAQTLVALLLYSGLRRMEAACLTWSDVDLDEAVLRVTRGKGGRDRLVPIVPELVEALCAWKFRSESSAWVFASETRPGAHIHDDTLWLDVVQAAAAAGVMGVHPHRLRHTYLTEAYRMSHNLRAVQELAGHASSASTQIYTKVDTSDLAQVVKGLNYRKPA